MLGVVGADASPLHVLTQEPSEGGISSVHVLPSNPSHLLTCTTKGNLSVWDLRTMREALSGEGSGQPLVWKNQVPDSTVPADFTSCFLLGGL